jgi:arylsulfatase A-like enzyme
MAIEYLKNYDREQPLFMVLSVMPPHFPFAVPEKFKRFDPDKLVLRPNFKPPENARQELLEKLAVYYAMIENLDWNIGRLMDTVEHLPDFENTLTIYMSDHGEYLGCHNFRVGKAHPHEESVRIPMIFHWPEVIPPTGTNNECLISLVDLQATVLGLLGIDKPVYDQGNNCSPAVMGKDFKGPEAVLLEMSGNAHFALESMDWRGLVTENWKYAFYENGFEAMYNLKDDPFEMDNLAGKAPRKREELKKMLLELLKETREPFFDVLIEHGIAPEHPDTDVSVDPEFRGLEKYHPASPE